MNRVDPHMIDTETLCLIIEDPRRLEERVFIDRFRTESVTRADNSIKWVFAHEFTPGFDVSVSFMKIFWAGHNRPLVRFDYYGDRKIGESLTLKYTLTWGEGGGGDVLKAGLGLRIPLEERLTIAP